MDFDKSGNSLTPQQLAAIFAGARRHGVLESDVNKQKVKTSLNEEIRLAQSKGEKDYRKAVDTAFSKYYPTRTKSPPMEKIREVEREIIKKEIDKARKGTVAQVNPAILEMKKSGDYKPTTVIDLIRKISVSNGISHTEARRLLESSNVIPPGIADNALLKPAQKEALKSGKFVAGEKPREPSAITNEVIRKIAERQKELERKQKIMVKIGNVRDEQTELLRQQIAQTQSVPAETPAPPGLVAGTTPLDLSDRSKRFQFFRDEGVERIDSPAKLSNAIESRYNAKIQRGIPSDIARAEARREVLSLI